MAAAAPTQPVADFVVAVVAVLVVDRGENTGSDGAAIGGSRGTCEPVREDSEGRDWLDPAAGFSWANWIGGNSVGGRSENDESEGDRSCGREMGGSVTFKWDETGKSLAILGKVGGEETFIIDGFG